MAKKIPLVSRRRFEDLRVRFRALQARLETATNLPDLEETFGLTRLLPTATCWTQDDWNRFSASAVLGRLLAEDEIILARHRFEEEWTLAGYSSPAGRFVNFRVDNLSGGRREGNRFFPNIRERLACPLSGLNNRQRLSASLISAELSDREVAARVYLMEQVTPLYQWISDTWNACEIVGSEYLGPDLPPGQVVNGIRHEDVHNLSLESASIDLVVSNDVMEHVPWPKLAFKEIARVLRPGGQALMTFPFFSDRRESIVRAEVIDGKVAHRHEPVFHGNPVSADGSLVFTDFGWDLFDLIRDQGFRDAAMEVYHSPSFGHLGVGSVIRLVR